MSLLLGEEADSSFSTLSAELRVALNQPSQRLEQPENSEQLALADELYSNASDLEREGKVFDALALYRRATQLDPYIEFNFFARQERRTLEGHNKANDVHKANKKTIQDPKLIDDSQQLTEGAQPIVDLYKKFQLDLEQAEYGGKLFLNAFDCAGLIRTSLHICDLPTEILAHILRWVVSTQLDMISLERVAATCKGFYMLARDEALWRLAAQRVWGRNQEPELQNCRKSIALVDYDSWRQMYIERKRVNFHGCYIGKNSYMRNGENSFQDRFHRPVQLVVYYRYLRFFPDGTCLMLVNADEPIVGINKLRNLKSLGSNVACGRYFLEEDKVKIFIVKKRLTDKAHGRVRAHTDHREVVSTHYRLEFVIKNSKGRLNWQIQCIKHVVFRTCSIDDHTEFNQLDVRSMAPLIFSPVRGYQSQAVAPLE